MVALAPTLSCSYLSSDFSKSCYLCLARSSSLWILSLRILVFSASFVWNTQASKRSFFLWFPLSSMNFLRASKSRSASYSTSRLYQQTELSNKRCFHPNNLISHHSIRSYKSFEEFTAVAHLLIYCDGKDYSEWVFNNSRSVAVIPHLYLPAIVKM